MGLPDAAAVFTTVGKILGHCCTRIPDGETGARGYWIRWQEKSFKDNPDIEPKRPAELKGFKDTLEHPFYGARAGVDPGGVNAGTLGYADHAIESFALFSGLERQGKIPPGLRFQVSLPTPVALLGGFVVIRDRAGLEPALERALLRDLDRLQDEIPHSRLAIQWDVCHEVLGADQGPPLHYEEAIQGSAQRLGRLCGQVAENVELEIHLCYGDPGHKHIVEPKDLEVAVGFANGICDLSPRRVDYIHMPVPRDRDDEAYFKPLEKFEVPSDTRLVPGLVHYTDGVAGTRSRMAVADRFTRDYDIGTECGFGRRAPETIPELLHIHREL